MIGKRISLASTDSTNTVAMSHVRPGLREAVLVVADEQHAGRGRRERTWTSPKGNLYCSLLLPPLPAVCSAVCPTERYIWLYRTGLARIVAQAHLRAEASITHHVLTF